MELSGHQIETLRNLMVARFPEYGDLEQTLRFMEPSVKLAAFSDRSRGMEANCFDVIQRFESRPELGLGLLLKTLSKESAELKQFAEGQLTPRPASTANNDGNSLQYLCNRLSQEMDFSARFSPPSPPTQIYLLPGVDGSMHQSFVYRLQDWTVPELLEMRGESTDGVFVRVASSWPQPLKGAEGGFILNKLARELANHAIVTIGSDATSIKQHPRLAGKIVLIEHTLYSKWWNQATVTVLRDYLRFWSIAVPPADRPARFLIFLHVIFPAGAPDAVTAPVLADLDSVAKDATTAACAVVRFEPLHCVEREHVDEWINTYVSRRRYDGDEFLDDLFPTGGCLPMSKVEPRLRRFANE